MGTATAHTPILDSALSGPEYLVSHGGAAFPNLEIVLEGEGITIVLDGKTNIENGITSSTFETVPDAPVSSFHLQLPAGPHSILAAPANNLCGETLRMPTTIRAQNGAQIVQSTLIEPQGCPNTLTIRSHTLRKHTLTLQVGVPGAGKLTARGSGLSTASATSHSRGTLTLKLKQRGTSSSQATVALTFTPSSGKQRKLLHKTITLTLG